MRLIRFREPDMRIIAVGLALALCAAPAGAGEVAVDVDVELRLPGVRIHIGERDPRGRYWDGRYWRDERWWHANCHRFRAHRDFRGRCDASPPRHCPPGQAKKGNC